MHCAFYFEFYNIEILRTVLVLAVVIGRVDAECIQYFSLKNTSTFFQSLSFVLVLQLQSFLPLPICTTFSQTVTSSV